MKPRVRMRFAWWRMNVTGRFGRPFVCWYFVKPDGTTEQYLYWTDEGRKRMTAALQGTS